MTEMTPRYRFRIIAAATMTVALVGFSITLVFPYLALKLAAEGYSRLYIGIATGIGGIANILVAPLVPSLAKRFGVQSVIVAALLTATLCLFLFDPFPYPAVDLTLRFLTGAAIGSLFIMGEFWINPHQNGAGEIKQQTHGSNPSKSCVPSLRMGMSLAQAANLVASGE